jgi:hypothetical protein
VFYINVPVGLLALAACYALLRDPDYLVKQRAELKKQPFHFDTIGLSLLVIVMVSSAGSMRRCLRSCWALTARPRLTTGGRESGGVGEAHGVNCPVRLLQFCGSHTRRE